MALQDLISPFVWGQGGAALTPEQIAQRNAVAKGLLASATDTSPTAGGWASILSKALAGGIAGYDMRSADNAEKANQSYNTDLVNSLFGGGAAASASPTASSASAGIPMTGAASEVSGSAPNLTGNQIYNDFIGSVQKGGLTNPYGLAAVAATGNAESGYDPAKLNASWPDPSQSGQPGTSGGLLSWRNERLANLRNYAQANGVDPNNISPSVQGQFFLQENPQLIQALNSAQSPQEAANLMANAWKFAGYNQPGGEAARRLASTSAFLPRFQSQQPVQVASATPQTATDAINAIAPPNAQPSAQTAYADPQVVNASNAAGAPSTPAAPVQQVAQALTAPQAASAASAMNPAIVRALTDPRASPQTQAVARALLQQQFAQDQAARQAVAQRNQAIFEEQLKQQDPSYQADLKLKNAQTDQIVNPRISPTDQANIDLNREKFTLDKENAANTNDIREFKFAQQNGYTGNFAQYQLDLKQAARPSTVINNGPNSNKFVEKSDEAAAKRFDDIVTAGQAAPQAMADMQQLLDLGSKIRTGGTAQVKAALGPYASALGINIDGLDEIQAYQAITSRLAPQMRAVGSGSSSDRDVSLFFQSLPNIRNRPGANEMIGNTVKAVAQNKINAAAIARQAQSGKITWQEADDQISKLPDPYELFKQFQQKASSQGGEAAPQVASPESPPAGIGADIWSVMTPEEKALWQQK